MMAYNNIYSSYAKGVDWVTVLLYVFLVFFGWANLYAANYNPEVGVQFNFNTEYFRQMVWIVVSAFCIGAIMLSDSKFFVEVAIPFYFFSLLLLLLVLFVGKEVYGAKSWLVLGPVAFQPSEFTKLGAALVVSRVISRYGFEFNFKSYLQLFAVILIPVVFILLQNDTGSALVYFVFLLPMFREGLTPHILILGALCLACSVAALLLGTSPVMVAVLVIASLALHVMLLHQEHPWEALLAVTVGAVATAVLWAVMTFILHRDILPEFLLLAFLGVVSLFLLIRIVVKRLHGILWFLLYAWTAIISAFGAGYVFEHVLEDHQRTRINVLFGIEDDPLGAGYNVNQSLIAIGSGGLLGKGYLAGTQTKLDFVPKQTTDFIFCTVGEEWGFIGSTALMVVYLFFFLRIIHLAEKQHSVFSRVYGYCVACIFFFHFAINVSMTIGLMPVIGIPLPFFSYGGSSLWGFSVMLFIFLKLDTDRNFLIR